MNISAVIVNGSLEVYDAVLDIVVVGESAPPENIQIGNKNFTLSSVYDDVADTFAHYIILNNERGEYEQSEDENLLKSSFLSVSDAADLAGVTVQAIRDILRDEARRADVFPGAFKKHSPKNDEWRIPRKDVEAYTPRKR